MDQEHIKKVERRRQFFKSFEAKSLQSRSIMTQISDKLTSFFGSTSILIIHVFIFAGWILFNTGQIIIPGYSIFDPYPFGFLTLCVSLEAIFLSLFILVSQNRQSYISTVREEVHMRVNLIAEEEITKILELVDQIRKEVGIKKVDPELEQMLQKTDTYSIEQSIINQLQRADKSITKQLIREFPDVITYPVRKPLEIIEGKNGSTEHHKEAKKED